MFHSRLCISFCMTTTTVDRQHTVKVLPVTQFYELEPVNYSCSLIQQPPLSHIYPNAPPNTSPCLSTFLISITLLDLDLYRSLNDSVCSVYLPPKKIMPTELEYEFEPTGCWALDSYFYEESNLKTPEKDGSRAARVRRWVRELRLHRFKVPLQLQAISWGLRFQWIQIDLEGKGGHGGILG